MGLLRHLVGSRSALSNHGNLSGVQSRSVWLRLFCVGY